MVTQFDSKVPVQQRRKICGMESVEFQHREFR